MKNYFFILLLAITTYTACSEQSTRPTQSSQVKDIGFIDPRDPYFAFVDFKPSCLNEEIQLNTESKETLLKQLTENETLETILYYVTQETLHPFNSTQILKNRAIKFTNSKNDIVTYGFNAFSHWAEVRFTKNSKIF